MGSTFVATVTVQYSVGAIGTWIDLATTYNSDASTSYLDGQDNQIIFYRIGVKTGDFTSGNVTLTLNFAAGAIKGYSRFSALRRTLS